MKPDFICIGPEKTATTWLFHVLEHHPDVKILLFVRNPIERAWSKALILAGNHAGGYGVFRYYNAATSGGESGCWQRCG